MKKKTGILLIFLAAVLAVTGFIQIRRGPLTQISGKLAPLAASHTPR